MLSVANNKSRSNSGQAKFCRSHNLYILTDAADAVCTCWKILKLLVTTCLYLRTHSSRFKNGGQQLGHNVCSQIVQASQFLCISHAPHHGCAPATTSLTLIQPSTLRGACDIDY